MHQQAYDWVRFVTSRAVPPRRVVELGGRDVNGSARPLFAAAEYVGVDVAPGPGADVVADAADWPGDGRPFDAAVCCEVLEHTPRGREVCANAARLLRPGGLFIVTAASPSRKPHSAVDGGPLRPGEWYRGVGEAELLDWLGPFGFTLIDGDDFSGDVYALAVKVGG